MGGGPKKGNIRERIMFMSHHNYFSENAIWKEFLISIVKVILKYV